MRDDDYWYAFECVSCPELEPRQGVMLDVRGPGSIAGGLEPPFVECPYCAWPMTHPGSWRADEDGYGSRASTRVVNVARAAAALERYQCELECRMVAGNFKKGDVMRQAAEWCADAIKRRRGL
jgi:hypothetical protein